MNSWANGKAPRTNFQASEKIQNPSSKIQGGTKVQDTNEAATNWSLVLEVFLELGAWDLVLTGAHFRVGDPPMVGHAPLSWIRNSLVRIIWIVSARIAGR